MKTITVFILVCLAFFTVENNFAQNRKCPRNEIDCPGLCGWFIDENHDGYCDLSEFSEETLARLKKTTDSIAKADELLKKHKVDSLKIIENKLQQNVIIEEKSDSAVNINKTLTVNYSQSQLFFAAPLKKSNRKTYDLITVLSICLGLYLFTYMLAQYNVIRKCNHRRIWNVVLLLTFLVTGLIGLFLVVQLNYEFKISWFSTLLYWHVEFGIAMATVSIFHILWHLRYWKNIFNVQLKKECE